MSAISTERAKWAIANRINPIRGLKPEKLADQLDAYDKGRIRAAGILWHEMEERDLLILNVASKRKQAVSRAQWEVLTIGDSPEAMQQKEVLEVFYNNLITTSILKQNERGGMGLLQRQMMDAAGKGFSVHEIVWKHIKGRGTQRSLNRRPSRKLRPGTLDVSGGPGPTQGEFLTATFTHCPIQFFENTTGKLRFLKNDYDTDGIEMKEAEWLVTCDRPMMKATSIGYVYKHLPLKFWIGYAEKFGMPGVLAKVPGKKGDQNWTDAEEAVSQFMNEFGAVMSIDSILELIETKGGGSNLPFPPLVEYIDRLIASLWRGADLSTISQGNGDGTGASVQGDETNLLQEDDAGKITETFWDQVDRQVLWHVLGVEEPLAYLKILPPKKQAVDQDIKIDEFLVRMGVLLSQDDALERYGRGAAEEGDDLLSIAQSQTPTKIEEFMSDPAEPLGNTVWEKVKRVLRLANRKTAEDRARAAKRELLKPFTDKLQAIGEMTDREAQRNALFLLQAELPSLKTQLKAAAADSKFVDVLANEMTTALSQTLSRKPTFKKGTR